MQATVNLDINALSQYHPSLNALTNAANLSQIKFGISIRDLAGRTVRNYVLGTCGKIHFIHHKGAWGLYEWTRDQRQYNLLLAIATNSPLNGWLRLVTVKLEELGWWQGPMKRFGLDYLLAGSNRSKQENDAINTVKTTLCQINNFLLNDESFTHVKEALINDTEVRLLFDFTLYSPQKNSIRLNHLMDSPFNNYPTHLKVELLNPFNSSEALTLINSDYFQKIPIKSLTIIVREKIENVDNFNSIIQKMVMLNLEKLLLYLDHPIESNVICSKLMNFVLCCNASNVEISGGLYLFLNPVNMVEGINPLQENNPVPENCSSLDIKDIRKKRLNIVTIGYARHSLQWFKMINYYNCVESFSADFKDSNENQIEEIEELASQIEEVFAATKIKEFYIIILSNIYIQTALRGLSKNPHGALEVFDADLGLNEADDGQVEYYDANYNQNLRNLVSLMQLHRNLREFATPQYYRIYHPKIHYYRAEQDQSHATRQGKINNISKNASPRDIIIINNDVEILACYVVKKRIRIQKVCSNVEKIEGVSKLIADLKLISKDSNGFSIESLEKYFTYNKLLDLLGFNQKYLLDIEEGLIHDLMTLFLEPGKLTHLDVDLPCIPEDFIYQYLEVNREPKLSKKKLACRALLRSFPEFYDLLTKEQKSNLWPSLFFLSAYTFFSQNEKLEGSSKLILSQDVLHKAQAHGIAVPKFTEADETLCERENVSGPVVN